MLQSRHIRKVAFAAVLVMVVQAALASFSFTYTDRSDERNRANKYSLKNIGMFSHKNLSFSSIRYNLQFKGAQLNMQKQNASGFEVNSMLQFDRGNSTYLQSFKFKIKVPKFKTPTPPIR